MSLPPFGASAGFGRADMNLLVEQLNKGLFKGSGGIVDADGARISFPASQVSGIPEAAFVTGSYSGNDAKSRTISLGFNPRAVLVEDAGGNWTSGYIYSALALRGLPFGGPYFSALSITSSGFQVGQGGDAQINVSGRTYYYVAFK